MTEKTQVTQIRSGDRIDFDAHTGCVAVYLDTSDKPSAEWEYASGVQTVTSVERVAAPVASGMHYRRATAIRITFENGRAIDVRGTSKFPVEKEAENDGVRYESLWERRYHG